MNLNAQGDGSFVSSMEKIWLTQKNRPLLLTILLYYREIWLTEDKTVPFCLLFCFILEKYG